MVDNYLDFIFTKRLFVWNDLPYEEESPAKELNRNYHIDQMNKHCTATKTLSTISVVLWCKMLQANLEKQVL